jgi:hypothetical protein
MSRECTICKHYGLPTHDSENLERTNIYDELGTAVPINLCRKHSVELFKLGQKRFLVSHYRILLEVVQSDEHKFLEVLEGTIKENLDMIY